MSLQFNGPVEGWVVNFLSSNHWKIKELMTFEDAIQEAGYIFYLMKHRYDKRGEFKEDRQYMAIFKVFWNRHFIDLTKKNDVQKQYIEISQIKRDTSIEDRDFEEAFYGVGEDSIEALALMSKSVSSDTELRTLIDFLGNVDGEDLKELRKEVRFNLKQKDQKGNCYLCKKLGISTKRNLLQDLKAILQL